MKAGPLEQYLRTWNIIPRKDDPWPTRLHQFLLSNRVAHFLSVLTIIVEAVDTIATGSLLKSQAHVSVLVGTYSCAFVQRVVLYERRRLLQQWYATILAAVARVEGCADRTTQESMARTARVGLLQRRLYLSFGVSTETLIVYTLYRAPLRWGDSPTAVVLHWLANVMEIVATSSLLNAMYYFIPLLMTLHKAGADLLDATGRHLEVGPCLPWCAAVQSAVLRACLTADAILADVMTHVLFGIALVPLISTVQVIAEGGLHDVYAAGTAPIIMTLFVPLCLLGERLSEARRNVGLLAARGPWLEEALPQSRLRYNVMVAAAGYGAHFRASGVGNLDKPACFQALKSWFSFVQLLMHFYE